MIALNRGNVEWVDTFMVRREMGAAQSDVLGFGFSNRPIREAYLQQYLHQLQQVLTTQSGIPAKFPASQYFASLPAAGMLPSATINPSDFSQMFFPAQIHADISIIPEDELNVLVDESLMLPPIDLTAAADDLESTAVLILVPVPRTQLPTLKATLGSLVNPLRPAAPGMVFQRKPLEALRGLISVRTTPAVLAADTIQAKAWAAALAMNPLLWYAKRRNLEVRTELMGTPVPVATNELTDEANLTNTLRNAGLLDRFNALKAKASAPAIAELTRRLSSPVVASNTVLAASVLSNLEKAPTLDRVTVLQATESLADPKLGQGLAQINTTNPGVADPAVMKAVADSGTAAELDVIGRSFDKAQLTDVTNQVIALAKTAGAEAPAKIAELLKAQMPKTLRAGLVINRRQP
jgi:hypothetical protein